MYVCACAQCILCVHVLRACVIHACVVVFYLKITTLGIVDHANGEFAAREELYCVCTYCAVRTLHACVFVFVYLKITTLGIADHANGEFAAREELLNQQRSMRVLPTQ